MHNFRLQPEYAGLLVVDVQAKLVPLEDRADEVLVALQKIIRGCQLLELPIVVTEQYPQGLGPTVPAIKSLLGDSQRYLPKGAFSCLADPQIREELLQMTVQQWIVVGIEAHVCVLQTVKDLLVADKEVVVLNDAITSRSIYDFSTAIAEMRDIGARISSVETVLFELLGSCHADQFKAISCLIK
jgi:nicotinamidase-related amidase